MRKKLYNLVIAALIFSLCAVSCAKKTPGKNDNCLVAVYYSACEVESYRTHSPSYLDTGKMFPESVADVLDIVYYAFANPSPDGSVSLPDTNGLEDCLDLQANGTKVLLCVSGVSTADSSAFMEITSSEESTSAFAENLMNLVEKYGFDGVDIDWEAVTSEVRPDAEGMNLLMQTIRTEMKSRENGKGDAYLLTCAVPCSSWGLSEERFDFKTLNEIADYINVMSYDLNNEEICTHLSPLYSSSHDNGYGFGASYGADLLISRGVAESKIIIGCAGYGKAYEISDPVSSSDMPGIGQAGKLIKLDFDGSFASGTVFGSTIAEASKQYGLKQYTEYDEEGNFVGSWLFNDDSKIFITYDSTEAVQNKLAYAKAHPGMGIMVWSYTEDTDNHVMNTIAESYA